MQGTTQSYQSEYGKVQYVNLKEFWKDTHICS